MIERQKKILKNGLTHIHYYVPFLNTVTISFCVKVGSINETTDQLFGISHFLEHMLFNGSEKYPSAMETERLVGGMGIDQNAWTWFAQTNYYMNCIPEVIPEAFDILLNRVFYPTLRPKDIEKEKGIIQEERVMCENNPSLELHYGLNNALYEGTIAGHNQIGTKESIDCINEDLLREYHNVFYSPRNVTLITYGGVKFEVLIEQMHAKLETVLNKEANDLESDLLSKVDISNKELKIDLKKETSASFVQDHKIYANPDSVEKYANWVFLRSLLEGGKSSVLERALILDNSLVSSLELDVFINGIYTNLLFGATTNKANLDEVLDVYKKVFLTLSNFITSETINRVKGYLKGKLLRSIEDPFLMTESDLLNVEYVNQLVGMNIDIITLMSEIEKIDEDRLRKFLKGLKPIRSGTGIIR